MRFYLKRIVKCHLRHGDPFINSQPSLSCSVVSDSFMTPWTIALQAPLSMKFPSPKPRDLSSSLGFCLTSPLSENHSFYSNRYFSRSSGLKRLVSCCTEFISGISVFGPAAKMNAPCFPACSLLLWNPSPLWLCRHQPAQMLQLY